MESDPEVQRLHDVQAQANEVTDESLAATRRMVATAEETRDVGAKTLQELDSQGDQLRKVNQELDEINQDLKATEKTLTQMERCCGCCLCPCCASRNFERGNKHYNETFSKQPRDDLVTDQPGVESARATGGVRGGGAGGKQQYVQRITHDAREDEMEENLGAVHDILGDLKRQARAMGEEIEDQNELLQNIEDKAESNTRRVQAADRRAANILRHA
eukprot:m.9640 g.9640  ORF g.9640 m.9640 type:complete len:217 (-) comp6976_c0_seq1:349-999(-)